MLRFFALIFSLICLNASAKAIILSDSLADEGRLYYITDHELPDPDYYFEGRYSNGPTWPEYAFADRENYAVAGAMSNYSNFLEPELGSVVNDTGLLAQVDQYERAHPTPDNYTAVYIGIGANDILAFDTIEEGALKALIDDIISNTRLAMQRLEISGVKDFVLIGLPDLGTTPAMNKLPAAQLAILTRISDEFNEKLQVLAAEYNAKYVDMDGFLAMILKHPRRFKFTNTTDACYNEETNEVCDDEDGYVFWDGLHPTTRVHQLFADSLQ